MSGCVKRVLAVLVTAAAAFAGDDDGPGRGVARISVLNGDVSVRRGDSGDYVAAALNAPLVVQDRLLTGAGSRAEVQFDWANMVRLTSNSEVRFSELEYRRYQVQIARGTVTFRVLRDIDAEVELSTPSVSVRPVKRGTYRISVFDDGSSEITVRSGEAEIFTPRGSERLRSGRTMMARGTSSDPEFRVANAIHEDEWDRWNERRDRDLERSRSYSYVSRDIYGAEDLDHHGRWVYVPPYGWVWAPYVSGGWAPYRYGRWSWIDWYGWSWVSYDPWGWAPYHYGRWFHSGPYGWCWYPGSVYGRHYWRPGLVAFFGFGGVRAGFGFGSVGWVPLAPYEPYYAWYGNRYYGGYRNRTYIDNSVNIVNNVNITNIYRNARVNDAVTGIDAEGFGRGRAGSHARLSDAEFSRASLVKGQLPLTPERDSLRLADRDAGNVRSGREDGRFYSRREISQVDRVPFDQQRQGMEQITRRTFEESRGGRVAAADQPGLAPDASGRVADAPGRIDGSRAERTADNGQRGWRREDQPVRTSEPGRGTDSAAEGMRRFGGARLDDRPASGVRRVEERQDGWRRFGEPAGRGAAPDSGARAGTDEGNRRFGEPAIERSRPAQTEAGDWRRFGDRGGRSDDSAPARSRGDNSRGDTTRWDLPRLDRSGPRPEIQRQETPRSEPERREMPRMERRELDGLGRRGYDGNESIRISPPIVRERGGFGGGGRMERPAGRMDGGAPRMEMPRGGGEMRRGDFGGGAMRGGDSAPSRTGGDGGASRGGEARGDRGR